MPTSQPLHLHLTCAHTCIVLMLGYCALIPQYSYLTVAGFVYNLKQFAQLVLKILCAQLTGMVKQRRTSNVVPLLRRWYSSAQNRKILTVVCCSTFSFFGHYSFFSFYLYVPPSHLPPIPPMAIAQKPDSLSSKMPVLSFEMAQKKLNSLKTFFCDLPPMQLRSAKCQTT